MKPIAWMYEVNDTFILFSSNKPPEDAYDEGSLVPLYTAPRELSDEEIMDICIMGSFYDRISDPFYDKKTGAWSLDEDLVQFARAILKKANEK